MDEERLGYDIDEVVNAHHTLIFLMSIKYIYSQTFAGTPYLCELSTKRLY
jgi:hypothetical protein